MSEVIYVVKINTALSNKPFFVKIADPTMSVDRIFTEATASLRNTGRPLESQQLEQLYKQHSIFNSGNVIGKGDLFKDLEQKQQTVGDQTAMVAELDLVTSHSGGIKCIKTHPFLTFLNHPFFTFSPFKVEFLNFGEIITRLQQEPPDRLLRWSIGSIDVTCTDSKHDFEFNYNWVIQIILDPSPCKISDITLRFKEILNHIQEKRQGAKCRITKDAACYIHKYGIDIQISPLLLEFLLLDIIPLEYNSLHIDLSHLFTDPCLNNSSLQAIRDTLQNKINSLPHNSTDDTPPSHSMFGFKQMEYTPYSHEDLIARLQQEPPDHILPWRMEPNPSYEMRPFCKGYVICKDPITIDLQIKAFRPRICAYYARFLEFGVYIQQNIFDVPITLSNLILEFMLTEFIELDTFCDLLETQAFPAKILKTILDATVNELTKRKCLNQVNLSVLL